MTGAELDDRGFFRWLADTHVMPFLPTAAPDVLVVGDSPHLLTGELLRIARSTQLVTQNRARLEEHRQAFLQQGGVAFHVHEGTSLAIVADEAFDFVAVYFVNLAHSAPKSLLAEVPSRVRPGGVVWLYSVAHAERRPMIDGLGDEALMASFERSGLVVRAHLLVRRETSPPPFLDAITVLERR